METGITPEQIEAAKRYFKESSGDPIRLRLIVSLLLAGVGFLAVLRPMGNRLDVARALKKARVTQASTAGNLLGMRSSMEDYEPLVPDKADQVAFGNYLMKHLEKSGLKLNTMEPKKTQKKSKFKVVITEVVTLGTYTQCVDFVDRLERGPMAVRIDSIDLERTDGAIRMTCDMKCLIKERDRISRWAGADD